MVRYKTMRIVNIEDFPKMEKYSCGSPNLCKFIEEHNIKHVYSYKLGETKKYRTIWVFIMTPELSSLLKEWSNNKPKTIVKEGEKQC